MAQHTYVKDAEESKDDEKSCEKRCERQHVLEFMLVVRVNDTCNPATGRERTQLNDQPS